MATTNFTLPTYGVGDEPDGAAQITALANALDTALKNLTRSALGTALASDATIPTSSTAAVGLSVSMPVVNGYRYKVIVRLTDNAATANSLMTYRVRQDTTGGTDLAVWNSSIAAVGSPGRTAKEWSWPWDCTVTGTKAFHLVAAATVNANITVLAGATMEIVTVGKTTYA